MKAGLLFGVLISFAIFLLINKQSYESKGETPIGHSVIFGVVRGRVKIYVCRKLFFAMKQGITAHRRTANYMCRTQKVGAKGFKSQTLTSADKGHISPL